MAQPPPTLLIREEANRRCAAANLKSVPMPAQGLRGRLETAFDVLSRPGGCDRLERGLIRA